MIAPRCAAPVAFPALVDYWFGELDGERAAALEEHLFACGHCAARLEQLAVLGEGVRKAFHAGAVRAVLSAAFLEKLKREGVRVREYRFASGGAVSCTIAAGDDFVVGRFCVPLAGVKRLDLLEDIDGKRTVELRDVPFDPAAGEVIFCPPAAALRRMPAHVGHVRLVAVDEEGSRTLGEYTFNHSPS
ncbi:MAG TPA: zf-HC2 domain-containing protein [Burkholderiales bacterium]|nr:zf-HC2 domain-containing protein [Burkholderiales bacterium]